MKKHLFIILLTTFFKRIRWIGKIRDNHLNRLLLQYNIQLRLQQVKVRGWGHYELRNVFVKRSVIEIEMQRLELLLDWWTLIKQRAVKNALKIKIDKLEIGYQPGSKGAAAQPGSAARNVREIRTEWERVFYPKYEKIIHAFFHYSPESLVIQETSFKNDPNKYRVACTVDKNDRSVTVAIDNVDTAVSNSLSPFSFAHASLTFNEEEHEQQGKAMNWMVRSTGLRLQHRAIGAAPLLLSNFDVEAMINFTPASFVVTKESGGNINQIPFAFQFHHDLAEKDILKFIFHLELDPNLFKASFPAFHVKALESITTGGSLLIRSRLMFSMKDPMQHFFELKLLKNDLVIRDLGSLDLYFLEKPFVHKIYKDNAFVREIVVGEPESEFVEIKDLPTRMIDIITFCEDPNFYHHHGIDVYFIGRAIVSNLIERKFKRGASTITMQLVRNIFLNHEKNLYRKIEEVIIALLIENYFKISKARLLEIYVNIIEFGPGVYGMKAAALFYFKKPLQQLTITEYLIMMYIIPRPIHFYEALITQSPRLFANLREHVHWLSKNMCDRGIVTNEEFEKIISDTEIVCEAKSLILKEAPVKPLAELLRVDLPTYNATNTRNDLYWAYPLKEQGMPTVNLKSIGSADTRKEYIYKVIDWLDVEKSRRYSMQGKNTYCNIYVYDVVRCLGAYIPRVWWNEESISKIKKGTRVPVEYAKTVFEMNCNALAEWFPAHGACFGWKQVFDLTEMQSLANTGTIGIIVGQRKVLSDSGHITVVLPEMAGFTAQSSGKEIICPVQSQAGMRNRRWFTGDAWWQDADKFSKYSIWSWDLTYKKVTV